jgi:uncharacterized phage protein (TIGR01671 family)
MRQIKFRLRDKIINKVYHTGDLIDGTIVIMNIEGGLQFSSNDIYKEEDFEIQQYTGLQDKNGLDIYEGDILRHSNGSLFKIIWSTPEEDYAGWVAKYIKHIKNDKFDILFNTKFKECEVIGDIYNKGGDPR